MKPDFWLIFTEYRKLEPPRKCWIESRCSIGRRDDVFVTKVNPPIELEEEKYRTVSLDRVYIANRHKGFNIADMKKWWVIKNWPIYVHVAKIRENCELGLHEVAEDSFDIMVWGEVYPDIDSAWKELHSVYKKED